MALCSSEGKLCPHVTYMSGAFLVGGGTDALCLHSPAILLPKVLRETLSVL